LCRILAAGDSKRRGTGKHDTEMGVITRQNG
jgi:hypothetical protein